MILLEISERLIEFAFFLRDFRRDLDDIVDDEISLHTSSIESRESFSTIDLRLTVTRSCLDREFPLSEDRDVERLGTSQDSFSRGELHFIVEVCSFTYESTFFARHFEGEKEISRSIASSVPL